MSSNELLSRYAARAERALERRLPATAAEPAYLHQAMRYATLEGGKRLRAALVYAAGEALGAPLDALDVPACAVEMVHAYSLVHDDLPCMDDDDLRRGRPTCHKVYGEALAILAGDALLTLAFGLLARSGPRAPELAAALSRGAGSAGMVGGQVLDLAPTRPITRACVEEIHARKTASLLAASAEMGAIAAGAGVEDRENARVWGLCLGRCFQAVDDILDVTGDAHTLGKTPGKDSRENKPTLVAVLGLAGARAEARRLAGEAEDAARGLGCREGDLPWDLVEHLLARTF